jgi:hypothetical protein
VWLGLWAVLVSPSPKSQAQEVGVFSVVSVNCTARGALPPVTFVVKAAAGGLPTSM